MKLRSTLCVMSLLTLQTMYGQEICNNGIDDDADGLIDLNDTVDCTCTGITVATSHLNDPSFEEVSCIPTTFCEWNCSPGWSNGTGPTADLLHQDGFWMWMIPQPLPGGGVVCAGGAVVQSYRENLGTCLAVPLTAGGTYSLGFYMSAVRTNGSTLMPIGAIPPISITIFGSAVCPAWPTLTGCPESLPEWLPIGSVEYTPTGEWSLVELVLEPQQEVNAIQIGPPCGPIPAEYSLDSSDMFPYMLYDHFSLSGSQPLVMDSIEVTGSWCTQDLVLSIDPPPSAQTLQWFHEGVAIPGATGSSLDVSASGSPGGEYQFVCWSADGCDRTEITLEPDASPVPVPDVIAEQCAPALIQLNIPGVPPTAIVNWIISDGSMITGTNATHVLIEPGSYSVIIEVLYDNGCSWTDTYSDIIIQPGPEAAFDHTVEIDILGNTMLHVVDGSTGNVMEWEWDLDHPSEQLSGPSAAFDLGADPVSPGYVTLVVADDLGCRDTTRNVIEWQLPAAIHVPNSFTPNNDGINDNWGPFVAGNVNDVGEVIIFDRWGSPIWRTSDPSEHWDGTISGNPYPQAIYPWVITVNSGEGDTMRIIQGHVLLLR